jgi:hypothetical protein
VITQPFSLEDDNSAPHSALVQRFLNPLPEFNLLSVRDEARAEAKQLVRDRYHEAYNAEVAHFMPWLLTMQCLGHYSGVAGLQPGGKSPLYLEQYLEAPAEQVLSAKVGTEVSREALVEVGNLVAARKGGSHLLFLMFTAVLHAAGYEWIVFTATHALRNNLEKLGFPLVELKQVDSSTLSPEVLEEWGSYYGTAPVVMAGRLQDAYDLINSKALYRRTARMFRERILALAARITRGRHAF